MSAYQRKTTDLKFLRHLLKYVRNFEGFKLYKFNFLLKNGKKPKLHEDVDLEEISKDIRCEGFT